MPRLGEAEDLQELSGTVSALRLAHAVERTAEGEVVESGQFRIEIALVGDDAEKVLGGLGVSCTVESAHSDRSGVRACKPREKLMVVVFPAQLGPRAEKFTPADREGYVRQSLHVSESLAQP